MTETARIVDVSAWEEKEEDPDEPLGARGSTWLVAPPSEVLGEDLWIYKPVRARTVIHPDQTPWFEEDWAEFVATRVGELLHLPVARIELAVRDGHRGVVSPSFVRDRARPPTFGNELLYRADPDYPLDAKGEVPGYTPRRCLELLAEHLAPLGAAPLFTSAVDAFAGYLLLDALVANTDRHHENWAVLQHQGSSYLAPCYDLGTCLAFQLTDDQRREALETADVNRTVRAWCERGRSRTFEGRPQLVDAAVETLHVASETARDGLVEQLQALDDDRLAAVIASVPTDRMSPSAGTFATQVLQINRARLLERLS